MHAILDRLDDVTDSRPYRAEVLAGLRDVLGFDWYAWVGTDPGTTVGVDPLAAVPDLDGASTRRPAEIRDARQPVDEPRRRGSLG